MKKRFQNVYTDRKFIYRHTFIRSSSEFYEFSTNGNFETIEKLGTLKQLIKTVQRGNLFSKIPVCHKPFGWIKQ